MNVAMIRATLIASVLCRDGLLVCSDRREMLPNGGRVDTMRKVFPIGTNALYGATGSVELHDPDATDSFDVHTVVKNFFVQGGTLTLERITPGLATALETAAKGFFDSVKPRDWRRSYTGGGEMFRVVIYLALDGQITEVDTVGTLRVTSDAVGLSASQHVTHPYVAHFQALGGDGTSLVLASILGQPNPIWADLLADPLANSILFRKQDVRTLSLDDAERFARRLILVMSERKGLLGLDNDVSPQADCHVLTYGGDVSGR